MLIYVVLQLDCKSHFIHAYSFHESMTTSCDSMPCNNYRVPKKAELLPTLKKFSYQVTTNSPLHSSHHPSCCRLRSENPSLRSCHRCSLLVPVQTISINKWEPRVKNIQEKTLPTNKARNVPWRLEDTVPNGTSYYWVHSAPTGASRIVRRRRCPWRTLQWDRLEGAASHVWSFASKSPPGKQRVFCNVAPCVSRQIFVWLGKSILKNGFYMILPNQKWNAGDWKTRT